MKRKAPTMAEKLAAALLQLEWHRQLARNATFASLPTMREDDKRQTTAQILARFECDHYPVKVVDEEALGASGIPHINHPTNLMWRPKAEHREKTAKVDQPAIAKTKRIVKSWHLDDDPGSVETPIEEVARLMFPKPPPRPKGKWRLARNKKARPATKGQPG